MIPAKMKLLSAFLIFFSFTASFGQKVLRVNNNTKITSPYRTLSDAYDAANAGDIIQVEASDEYYITGSLICTKKINITGTGYFLSDNNVQSDKRTAKLSGTITFKEGSSGSIIQGVEGGSITIQTSNITIRRNKDMNVSFSTPPFTGAIMDSIVISQNWNMSLSSSYSSKILVKNNVLGGLSLYTDAVGVIQNNILTGSLSAYNSVFTNNIHTYNYDYSTGLHNCSVTNNVAVNKTFGETNGNKANVEISTIFMGTGTKETDYKLRANSPAVKAGAGGVDCGIFAGETPYILSGVPPIPTITQFNSAGAATKELPITISGKSNQ